MDESGAAADLIIRDGIQAAESTVKLTGVALKNVAALLIAISKQDYKVVGKTTSSRLARDPAPAEVVHIKKEDIRKFNKLAKKYGVLYFCVHDRKSNSPITNIVTNVNYVPQLNAIMEELGYPIPHKEESSIKKGTTPTPQESSSPEQKNGLNPRVRGDGEQKPSVRGKLQFFKENAPVIHKPKLPTRSR